MSEQPVISPDANGEPTPAPETAKTYTQEQINSAAAAARREAEAKLSDSNKRLAELEAKEKERQELELSELEKANKKAEELQAQIDSLTPFKTQVETQTEETKLNVAAKLEESDLDDDEKKLVLDSPISNQMALLDKLIAKTETLPPSSAGKYPGAQNPTKAAILAMPDGMEKRNAWKKFRDSGGV